MHRCIPLDFQDEWKDALKDLKHSFFHTWENCLAMSLTTGYKTYLYLFEYDGIKIACPLSEREYSGYTDIVTPYGFSGFTGNKEYPDFIRYWKEFVREKNYVCGYLCLNSYTSDETYYNSGDAFISTNLYFIDLRKSLTDIFENLDSNRRKQLRDFKKAEASFIYDRKLLTDFLLNNFNEYLKRINASKANFFSDETLRALCSFENVFVTGAGDGGKIDAVYLFGYTEHTGDCLLNVANENGRKYSSLLFWRGLKFFKSKKINLMNLGGGNKTDDSVALSKERFGAYKLPLVNLKQIYDEDTYKKLCAEKNIIQTERDGYFPAYRK